MYVEIGGLWIISITLKTQTGPVKVGAAAVLYVSMMSGQKIGMMLHKQNDRWLFAVTVNKEIGIQLKYYKCRRALIMIYNGKK